MSEEQTQDAQPKQETVSVDEQTMEQVNNEITAGQEQAKAAGKEEAAVEAKKSIDELKQELEAVRAKTAEMEAEHQRQDMERQLAEEKAKLEAANKPQRRGVVPESNNPIRRQEPVQPVAQPMTPAQEWAAADAAFMAGQIPRSVRLIDLQKNGQ